MKIALIALTLAAAAAPCLAQQVPARTSWDDPFELKDIRSGFNRMRKLAVEETEDVKNAPAQVTVEPAVTAQKLLSKRRAELELLYKASPSGPIPDGKAAGFAAVAPGTPAGGASEALFSLFWHGKIFDRKNGRLINRLTIGHVVKAKVFVGPSWLDGKPSVIIDYKGTSWIAGAIRDEIREVAPGVYLGFAYVRDQDGGAPRADIVFALDFNPQPPLPPGPAPQAP